MGWSLRGKHMVGEADGSFALVAVTSPNFWTQRQQASTGWPVRSCNSWTRHEGRMWGFWRASRSASGANRTVGDDEEGSATRRLIRLHWALLPIYVQMLFLNRDISQRGNERGRN